MSLASASSAWRRPRSVVWGEEEEEDQRVGVGGGEGGWEGGFGRGWVEDGLFCVFMNGEGVVNN